MERYGNYLTSELWYWLKSVKKIVDLSNNCIMGFMKKLRFCLQLPSIKILNVKLLFTIEFCLK